MQKLIHVYKAILPYFWNTKRTKIALVFTGIFIGLDITLTTYFPYIWKNLIAPTNQNQPTEWFILFTVILFVVWFAKNNLINLKEMVFFQVTNEAIKGIRLATVLKVHHISLQNLNQYPIQEIISATTRISQSIRMFMRASFISIFPNIGKLISLSIALLIADKICLGILFAALLSVLLILLFLKPYKLNKYKAWHLTDQLLTAIDQNLRHTDSVRFHPQQSEKQLFDYFHQEAQAWQKYNSLLYTFYIAQDLIFYSVAGVVFGFTTLSYCKGTMPVDKLILIYGLISSMHTPLLSITNNIRRFLSGLIDLDKTFTILNLPEENKDILLRDLLPKPIQLIDVSFSYMPERSLLKHIDLAIHPGEKIAICGASGTGKSTLCQLIVGLISPHSGQVFYGNLPMHRIQPASLGQMLTYIPQSYGEQELVVQPHPYGIKLEKRTFSPGEYQRYLLKKLLEEKPSIVVLDEALHALDAPAAQQILQKLIPIIPTIILVSHSKAILETMEKIYELKDGQLYRIQ